MRDITTFKSITKRVKKVLDLCKASEITEIINDLKTFKDILHTQLVDNKNYGTIQKR